jgi:hypothetical protein
MPGAGEERNQIPFSDRSNLSPAVLGGLCSHYFAQECSLGAALASSVGGVAQGVPSDHVMGGHSGGAVHAVHGGEFGLALQHPTGKRMFDGDVSPAKRARNTVGGGVLAAEGCRDAGGCPIFSSSAGALGPQNPGVSGSWYMGDGCHDDNVSAMEPEQNVGSVYEQYLARYCREQQLEGSTGQGLATQTLDSHFRCPAAWSGTEWDVCPLPFAAMDCDRDLSLECGDFPPRGC